MKAGSKVNIRKILCFVCNKKVFNEGVLTGKISLDDVSKQWSVLKSSGILLIFIYGAIYCQDAVSFVMVASKRLGCSGREK